MGRPRVLRPQLRRDSFYESDCQGWTSGPLIAGRHYPEQSAPTVELRRSCDASVVPGQSFASASVTSLRLPIRPGRVASARVAPGEPRSIGDSARSRPDAYSGSARGPAVRRVPRLTAGRANESLETAPRTLVPDPGACGEVTTPHRRIEDPVTALASSVASDRSAPLSSTAVARSPPASGPASRAPAPRAFLARSWRDRNPGAARAAPWRPWPHL